MHQPHIDKHFVNKDYISGLKIGKKDTNSEDEEYTDYFSWQASVACQGI